MKHLRQYIRQILLTEAMKTPNMLPEDVIIVIDDNEEWDTIEIYYAVVDSSTGKHLQLKQNDRVNAYLPDGSKSEVWGNISIEEIDEYGGDCDDSMQVHYSSAGSGWGPLLYDVAIEWASLKGGGLTPDRDSVSQEASNVWNYYFRNRKDVNSHQLDNLSSELTTTPDDDCDQEVAESERKDSQWPDAPWHTSPLSKRYTKPPTTINALKASGKLRIL